VSEQALSGTAKKLEALRAAVIEQVTPMLEAGETIRGGLHANNQKSFSAQLLWITVTDRRLFLVPLSRRAQVEGAPTVLRPQDIVSCDADGAGQGWFNVSAAIMDKAAVTLKMRTNDDKYKLYMMRGGDGAMGALGGGPAQSDGLTALGKWFEEHSAGR
jgi:hypothetical protein